jgi:YtcA family
MSVYASSHQARRATAGPLALLGLLGLGGCQPGAPSLNLVGSYFPAWILCSLIGVAVGLAARAVLSATRLADVAAYPLVVCIAVGVIAGVVAWLVFYRG